MDLPSFQTSFESQGEHAAVLFCDHVCSTAYKNPGLQALTKTVLHNKVATDRIHANDGTVAKFLADGVLATFHSESAERRALSAALEIIDHLDRENTDHSADSPASVVETKIGVHAGKVWMFRLGDSGPDDPMGTAVDIAARICALAGRQQVACTRQTYAAVESDDLFSNASGPHQRVLKGFNEPVEVVFLAPKPWKDLLTADVGLVVQATIVNCYDKINEGHLIRAVAIPWFEILCEIQRDPDFLFRFAKYPRKFEEFIAGAYERAGWPEVVLTPRSNDGGRDIIVTKPGFGSIRFLEQCKAYSPATLVTHDDVRAMLGVLQTNSNASKGIITTTSDFQPKILTSEQFKPFMPHRLELKNGSQLRDWLLEIANKHVWRPNQ